MVEEVVPVSIAEVSKDTFVMNMGQNMVGWLKLKVEGKKGIQFRFGFQKE